MFIITLLFALYFISPIYCDTTRAPQTTITIQQLSINKECTVHRPTHPTANQDQKWVLELYNARVYEDGHIITHDNFLLKDTIVKNPAKPLSEHHMLHRHELPQAVHIKGRVAIVSSPGSQCYYHWMLQILPRIGILRDLSI